MKSIFTFFSVLLCSLSAFAQPPQAFNYQGIARDGSGTPLVEKNISLRLSILQGAFPGLIVYQENHYVLTNKFGVFSTEVGHGSAQSGLFEAIEWGVGDHYIQIEMDPEGGTNFTLLGSSQLLSVPYALYAGNGAGGESLWQENAKGIHYNDGNVGIGTQQPEHKLSILGNDPNGDGRVFITLNNRSTSNRSWSAMRLAAGDSGSYTYLNHHASSYDYDGNKFTDFGQVSSTGRGLILRADDQDGIIKFLVGGNPLSPFERMRIAGNGYVGIGTENPENLFSINGNQDFGDERFFISVNNNSLSNRSFSAAKFTAGGGTSMTTFGHNSETYDVNNSITADFGGIFSSGAGIHLTAGGEEGIIKFLTGIDQNGFSFERMRLTTDGKLGLGTEAPASRLQIADGDVYIQDINNGVIMKSPNGSCWRLTVKDDGTIQSTAISCPE